MAQPTVLVVDDEPRIVDFLEENLRADDFTVLSAASGEDALELLRSTRPDLLLLDVLLPGISRIDVCREVRSGDGVTDRWDPDLPIIMLSAKAARALLDPLTPDRRPPAHRVVRHGHRAAPRRTAPARCYCPLDSASAGAEAGTSRNTEVG